MRTLIIVTMLLGCGETQTHSASELPSVARPQLEPFAEPQRVAVAAEGGSGCPYVLPPLEHIGVVIHNRVGDKFVIDSTGKTCDRPFCALQDRICCPVAPEGNPYRLACENQAFGIASDGVAGTEWSIRGGGTLSRHPSNPYLAFAWGPGTVKGCIPNQPEICAEVELPLP